MKQKSIEVSLSYYEKNWIGQNEDFLLTAPSLQELDKKITTFLRNHKKYKNSNTYKCCMSFNNATIPRWMWQYMPHYFNRIVYLYI